VTVQASDEATGSWTLVHELVAHHVAVSVVIEVTTDAIMVIEAVASASGSVRRNKAARWSLVVRKIVHVVERDLLQGSSVVVP